MQIPPLYTRLLEHPLQGTVLLLGGPDTGKSTLAGFLVQALSERFPLVAHMDTDPGQNNLGPPTTMALRLLRKDRRGSRRRYFVGNTSPRGHMLPMITGVARLSALARQAPVRIVDTCGLIAPEAGGLILKNTKIELLRPAWILALQHGEELEPILRCWSHHTDFRILRLKPPEVVRRKTPDLRRKRRNDRFKRYFARSKLQHLDLSRCDLFPYHSLRTGRLLALQDADDFLLALGILITWDPLHRHMVLLTPLPSLHRVRSLRTGRLLLNPLTREEMSPHEALPTPSHVSASHEETDGPSRRPPSQIPPPSLPGGAP